ncbi:Arylsulfatase precursor [Aureliella helgolandensis]|uniref:Arylsulfatase n=1 Tax=Aureliella helgolandensis TaxID=2527968 RepID=A0A518G6H3_9BACT|nr:Arylsulfatase precursor [Aureliella helgolandensis]
MENHLATNFREPTARAAGIAPIVVSTSPAASAVGAKLLAVILTMTATFTCTAQDSPARPNILLILADDLGYGDVGFNGATDIRTPTLDQLAADGIVFTSAYVVHPFCGPSRMALLSGRYPYEFGAPFNLPDDSSGQYRDQGISPDETLISTVLQDAGYRTGVMGKWHLGQQPEFHPNRRGFEDYFGFLGGGILYFGPYKANNEKGNVWDYKRFPEHNGADVTSLTESDYMTDVLSGEGVRFINGASRSERPFFLFMSYNAPHTVLAAKEEDMAQFSNLQGKRRIYAGMVHALDRGINSLVDALKASGQYDNTLIVFFSDNGGRADQGASNLPLRGGKGDTYEGGYRTPMFFHWPGVVQAGQRYDHPVTALDFYPTLARLAEADIPTAKHLDGKDIWEAVLAGENAREGELIYTVRHQSSSTDVGARKDQWKICHKNEKWQLFNLHEDIGETNDLSAKYPERLKQMVAEVEQLCQAHTRPLWFDNANQAEQWKSNRLPYFDGTFSLRTDP